MTHIQNHNGRYKIKRMLGQQPENADILLVDDDPFVRKVMAQALRSHGFTVVEAASGPEAIAYLDFGNFKLLLTDIVMPGMDGFELAETILKTHPHIKTFFISGYIGEQNLSDHPNLKGSHFLQKPFSMKEIVERIEAICKQ
jgi:two-component system cell cycle sensor histidine kinase/response regulator CckA